MTITYPRAMPEGIGEVEFEPAHAVTSAPEQGGRPVSEEIGQTRWRARFRTVNLRGARLGVWRAFLASLRNGARSFYCGDPSRPFPLAYPAGFGGLVRAGPPEDGGGDPFDGAATAWSLNLNRDTPTLEGLPDGFTIAPGDYVGFVWGGTRRFMARALEAAVADEDGALSVQVEPFVPLYVPPDAVANLARPDVVMRLLPNSAATPFTKAGGVFAFEAVEDCAAVAPAFLADDDYTLLADDDEETLLTGDWSV